MIFLVAFLVPLMAASGIIYTTGAVTGVPALYILVAIGLAKAGQLPAGLVIGFAGLLLCNYWRPPVGFYPPTIGEISLGLTLIAAAIVAVTPLRLPGLDYQAELDVGIEQAKADVQKITRGDHHVLGWWLTARSGVADPQVIGYAGYIARALCRRAHDHPDHARPDVVALHRGVGPGPVGDEQARG